MGILELIVAIWEMVNTNKKLKRIERRLEDVEKNQVLEKEQRQVKEAKTYTQYAKLSEEKSQECKQLQAQYQSLENAFLVHKDSTKKQVCELQKFIEFYRNRAVVCQKQMENKEKEYQQNISCLYQVVIGCLVVLIAVGYIVFKYWVTR